MNLIHTLGNMTLGAEFKREREQQMDGQGEGLCQESQGSSVLPSAASTAAAEGCTPIAPAQEVAQQSSPNHARGIMHSGNKTLLTDNTSFLS